MRKIIKKISLLLVITILLSVAGLLSSCKKGNNSDETSGNATASTGSSDTEDIDYKTYLPEADFGGADVNIYVMSTRLNQFDNVEGDPLSEEVVARNKFVENKYNVYLHITADTTGWSGFTTQCQADLWAGEAEYDITVPDYYYKTETAGYFVNLADYDVIHFENPYWVSGWNDNVKINGKIFTAVSYYTIDPVRNAEVLFLNNYLAEDLRLDVNEIKQKVYNGAWTIGEMLAIMKVGSYDLNADGEFTFDDRYGLAYNLWGGRAMLWSAGLKLSDFSDDNVTWALTSAKNVDIFQDLYKLFNDNNYSYYGGGAGSAESPIGDGKVFNQNRALLRTASLGSAAEISQNLDSFSVLPMPKYELDQNNYTTSLLGSVVFGIMKTAKDPVMSATILEAMSILTYEDIIPVYYEETLKLRYMTDPDAAKMIDLVTDCINIDFAFINSNNFDDVASRPFDMIVDYNRNYVSGMKQYEDAIEQNMEIFYKAYSDDVGSDS